MQRHSSTASLHHHQPSSQSQLDSLKSKSRLPQLINSSSHIGNQWNGSRSYLASTPGSASKKCSSSHNHDHSGHSVSNNSSSNSNISSSSTITTTATASSTTTNSNSTNQRRLQRFQGAHQLPLSDHCSSDEGQSQRQQQYGHRAAAPAAILSHRSEHMTDKRSGHDSDSALYNSGQPLEPTRPLSVKFSDLNLSPEILFLIKEHAKTVANIKSISRRLHDLELKVESIHQTIKDRNCCFVPAETKSKGDTVPHVLSDDSGGEYSRTTTGTTTDEDELLSLLDQIAKCSHQIHQTQQAQQYQSQVLYNSLSSRQCPQSSANSMPGLYSYSTSSVYQPTNNSNNNSSNTNTNTTNNTNNLQKQQSLSALLFEPNVERFLTNLDHIIDGQQQSASFNGGSGSLAAFSQTLSSSEDPVSRHMERARHLINRREQEGIKSQAKLAEDWLVSHSRDRPQPVVVSQVKQHQVGQRYIDSFDQGFRL